MGGSLTLSAIAARRWAACAPPPISAPLNPPPSLTPPPHTLLPPQFKNKQGFKNLKLPPPSHPPHSPTHTLLSPQFKNKQGFNTLKLEVVAPLQGTITGVLGSTYAAAQRRRASARAAGDESAASMPLLASLV